MAKRLRQVSFTLNVTDDDIARDEVIARLEVRYEGVDGFGFADVVIDVGMMDYIAEHGSERLPLEFVLSEIIPYAEAIEQIGSDHYGR